ncbi:Undecaprenyl-diphosphatase [Limihaloglobus sulfuriphilus]|uniref:Undecaprenyl-diphosphatase n=1 Tax=Limihaloglobus sulfuriphilus TaxID=1851148 RepID=A0A1Q2MBA6_9BACT|nr:phosphatidylglycerophosphatase A [Limihaloglobus sulfuriphilus]AQQ69949.1 Undecaprenyl-diphosphatase [Limihaloglobus sulfuriphilus]
MKRIFTSCFGLGFMPVASGTWGSLLPVVVFMAMGTFAAPAAAITAVLLLSGIFFSFICVRYGTQVADEMQLKDPGEIVADEYAGQALTLILAVLFGGYTAGEPVCLMAGAAFLLFRLFDIVKPWPIRSLEKYPGGWGVLLDDLLAGVYAGVVYIIVAKTGIIERLDCLTCSGSASGGLTVDMAVVLGIVQGLTEFLPVSSSGHLVVFEDLFAGLDPDTAEMLLFDLSIHVGTVIAVIAVFYKDIIKLVTGFFNWKDTGFKPLALYRENDNVHFAAAMIVTIITTFIFYKIFEEPLDSARKVKVVVVMWLVTAALLFITDLKKDTTKTLRQIGLFSAAIIGAAQAAAILPGISRSGATICAAILLGLKRDKAVEYSFFVAIPVILGASVLEFIDKYDLISGSHISPLIFAAGMAASFLTGIAALKLLINLSRQRRLKWFSIYLFIVAALVFYFEIM